MARTVTNTASRACKVMVAVCMLGRAQEDRTVSLLHVARGPGKQDKKDGCLGIPLWYSGGGDWQRCWMGWLNVLRHSALLCVCL